MDGVIDPGDAGLVVDREDGTLRAFLAEDRVVCDHEVVSSAPHSTQARILFATDDRVVVDLHVARALP